MGLQPVLPWKPKWRQNGVNLENFSKVADDRLTDLATKNNLSKRLACITDILSTVAEVYVGKTKPRRKAKPRMKPHVRTKIRTRNWLDRAIDVNPQEWIEACRESNEEINDDKTNGWKKVLEEAMKNNSRQDM